MNVNFYKKLKGILNKKYLIALSFFGLYSFLLYQYVANQISLNYIIKINEMDQLFSRTNLALSSKLDILNKDADKLYDIVQDLSLRLNLAYQKNGRLNCEITKGGVSENGGWCSSISGRNSSQHMTDYYFANATSLFLKDKQVASLGDGPGIYKELFEQLGHVISYDAFDGAPFAELTTDNRVKFLDLSVPVYHLNLYDWIISVEVAEHIPKEYEHIYLDNIVRFAKEGVILSWAKIGQGGLAHINNQNFSYVKEQMEKRGFKHDEKDSFYLKSKCSTSFFKENLNVFRKISIFSA